MNYLSQVTLEATVSRCNPINEKSKNKDVGYVDFLVFGSAINLAIPSESNNQLVSLVGHNIFLTLNVVPRSIVGDFNKIETIFKIHSFHSFKKKGN